MSPSTLLLSTLALLSASTAVRAHMQLSQPYPYNSALNPATPEASKDYSMTAPLVSNGLPYPCKGYIGTADQGTRPSWTAGQSVSVNLAGTAVHGGGSCQFGLSYDNGANFYVIKSYMGGCPSSTTSFDVEIPSDAPSGNGVIFSWSWFNKVGNREMYQNCLAADITGTSSKALSGPTIMVANAGSASSCSTTEGTAVVFESPGTNVVYMGEYAGLSIGNGLTSGAGVVGSNCYAAGSVGKGSSTGSTTSSKAATSSKAVSSKAASSTKPASSTKAATSTKKTTSSTKVATSSGFKTTTALNLAVQTTTTTTKKASSAAAAATSASSEECTTGDWKCVGSVLTQCAQSKWTSITDCNLQSGTVCNASTPVGCVWPFQVTQRKRALDSHKAKRRMKAGHGSLQ